MRLYWQLTVSCIVLIALSTVALGVGELGAISEAEQARWVRWLIPLPKQIEFAGKVTLPISAVKITVRDGAGEVEQTAAAQLKQSLPGNGDHRFEISIDISDAGGELADLPNREQAYVIRPVGENRLVLTALDERGVYYAVQTLRQLLEATLTDGGNVTIPLVTVTDWPDLAERGAWGGNTRDSDEILWMARHKLNLVAVHVPLRVQDDGQAVAEASPKRIELGRRHALNVVPIITHLSHIPGTRIYEVYPQLEAKGGTGNGSPCALQPKFVDVLADWMCSMAGQGAADISAWLSEGPNHQCSCPKCLAEGKRSQYHLEARAYVKAWRLARSKYPNLEMHVMLSQGSYPTNDKVLAEIPADTPIGVSYYHGGKTYNSSQEPMIYPLLEDYAAKGGWLAVVPQISASYEMVTPWSAPQFIKYRMNEYVQKKLACVCAYPTPNSRLYDFNVTAMAEWSWNSAGRSEREFAAAWATRRGLSDPDAAAEWAVTLGDAGWDFYGADIPLQYLKRGKAAAMVAGRARPQPGKGMFKYLPTLEHIDRNLAACDNAMALAKRLANPSIIQETRVIQGYLRMAREIFNIATWVADASNPTYDQRVELQNAMNTLALACYQTNDGLERWERATGPDLSNNNRYQLTMLANQRTVDDIADAVLPFAIRKPVVASQRRQIGEWTSEDFEPEPRITTKWDVSNMVLGNGVYKARFSNASHFWLDIYRVALVSQVGAGAPVELAVDEHTGRTGYHRSKANIYTLMLDRRQPAARYFLVADIEGHRAEKLGGVMKHCKGIVWFKSIQADEQRVAAAVTALRPLSDDQLAQWRKGNIPQFTGKGLRIGVLQNGLGAGAIAADLGAIDGFDTQPLVHIAEFTLEPCQVVIVPQPKSPMGKSLIKALEQFVRSGGGLIVTHNAVGYRGHPTLITEICAKGLEHVRDTQWIVTRQHPITQGIDPNKALPHSYYDHIELECGPKGVVLAQGYRTRRPVVIAGEYGKGRYVACGLIPGLGADGSSVAPTGAEQTLLRNAVRWCGRMR